MKSQGVHAQAQVRDHQPVSSATSSAQELSLGDGGRGTVQGKLMSPGASAPGCCSTPISQRHGQQVESSHREEGSLGVALCPALSLSNHALGLCLCITRGGAELGGKSWA